jgi:hypothetical protein
MVIGRKVLFPILLCCSCFGPFDPYNPAPDRNDDPENPDQPSGGPSTDLIAYYTCNDSEGTQLTDSVGSYHGWVTGCQWVEGGVEGRALSLDGMGDYVSIATSDSAFDFGEGPFTISLWVKPRIDKDYTDSSRYDIISKGVVEEKGYTLSIYRQRYFSAFIGPIEKGSVDSTFSASEERWFHCVMLRRGSGSSMDVELYVDGQIIQSYSNSVNLTTSNLKLLIGCDSQKRQENFYSGLIDEIKIFNTAWSSNEVNGEFRRFSPNE